jgi:hypothetical protein
LGLFSYASDVFNVFIGEWNIRLWFKNLKDKKGDSIHELINRGGRPEMELCRPISLWATLFLQLLSITFKIIIKG